MTLRRSAFALVARGQPEAVAAIQAVLDEGGDVVGVATAPDGSREVYGVFEAPDDARGDRVRERFDALLGRVKRTG